MSKLINAMMRQFLPKTLASGSGFDMYTIAKIMPSVDIK
jgi:hypothetical protein